MPAAIPQRYLYEHGPLTTLMLREHSVRLLQEAGLPTDQSPPPPSPYPPPFTLQEAGPSTDQSPSPPSPYPSPFTLPTPTDWSTFIFTNDADVLGSDDAPASAAGSDFKGTWKRFTWDGNCWWHNDETGEWFFEKTGTTVRPTSEEFGKCCSKYRTSPASPGGGYKAPYLPGRRPMPRIPED